MPVDLTPLEFMQLMEMAQRRVMLKGNDLNQEGRPHEEMFLIVEGTADVGVKIPSLFLVFFGETVRFLLLYVHTWVRTVCT